MKTKPVDLHVVVQHVMGPEADEASVYAWLCADGAWFEGRHGGFYFDVCPRHMPEECECSPEVKDEFGRYEATVHAVSKVD